MANIVVSQLDALNIHLMSQLHKARNKYAKDSDIAINMNIKPIFLR